MGWAPVIFLRMRQDTPPQPKFETAAQETVVTLFVTATRVRQAFADVVESHGMTLQQLNVLRILRGAGAAGLPTMLIAERMIDRDPGITKLVDRLERKDLAKRHRLDGDRRRIAVVITQAGLAKLRKVEEPIAQADQAIVSDLSLADQRQLVTLLRRLRYASRRVGRR